MIDIIFNGNEEEYKEQEKFNLEFASIAEFNELINLLEELENSLVINKEHRKNSKILKIILLSRFKENDNNCSSYLQEEEIISFVETLLIIIFSIKNSYVNTLLKYIEANNNNIKNLLNTRM